MATVSPTPRWNSRTLFSPVGIIRRPVNRLLTVEVTDPQAAYLVKQGLATLTNSSSLPQSPASSESPNNTPVDLDEVSPSTEAEIKDESPDNTPVDSDEDDNTEFVAAWQKKVVAFLKKATVAEIEAVKGISQTTAQSIYDLADKAGDGFDWAMLDAELSSRYIQALQKWATISTP